MIDYQMRENVGNVNVLAEGIYFIRIFHYRFVSEIYSLFLIQTTLHIT